MQRRKLSPNSCLIPASLWKLLHRSRNIAQRIPWRILAHPGAPWRFPALLGASSRNTAQRILAPQQSCDHASWYCKYSQFDWQRWLSGQELDQDTMNEALRFCMNHFEEHDMHPATRAKIRNWRWEDTSSSRVSVRNTLRQSFSAYLKQSYGYSQIAKFLLKYGSNQMPKLLVASTQRLQRRCAGVGFQAVSAQASVPKIETVSQSASQSVIISSVSQLVSQS